VYIDLNGCTALGHGFSKGIGNRKVVGYIDAGRAEFRIDCKMADSVYRPRSYIDTSLS
jgi:hypothetical protein